MGSLIRAEQLSPKWQPIGNEMEPFSEKSLPAETQKNEPVYVFDLSEEDCPTVARAEHHYHPKRGS